MAKRPGQNGYVVKKGLMWHGRYYVDVAGQEQRKRMSIPLGFIADPTKPEARHKLREVLAELGVNTAEHLERAVQAINTFGQEAEWWRENRLPLMKRSTQDGMTGHLNNHLLPYFGHLPVTVIEEKRVQEFVTSLTRAPLGAHSIQNIIGTLRLILGKKSFRDWNVAMPKPARKEQRYFTPEEMQRIIAASSGQWRVIFATLAGTGLRGGECLALHSEDLDLSANRITVRRGSYRGQETMPKTDRAYRAVSIDDGLVEVLRQHIAGRKAGPLFVQETGSLFNVDYARRKLEAILKQLGLPKGGLHGFRHGRVSVLRAHGVPDTLVTAWIGHSSLRTTDRYTHFSETYRKDLANTLAAERTPQPVPVVGPNGPNYAHAN